jgi:hypothetical protein
MKAARSPNVMLDGKDMGASDSRPPAAQKKLVPVPSFPLWKMVHDDI